MLISPSPPPPSPCSSPRWLSSARRRTDVCRCGSAAWRKARGLLSDSGLPACGEVCEPGSSEVDSVTEETQDEMELPPVLGCVLVVSPLLVVVRFVPLELELERIASESSEPSLSWPLTL